MRKTFGGAFALESVLLDNVGMSGQATISAQRIVVVMPSWLGDAVMATPMLRTLRELYPTAFIAALHKPLLGAVMRGLPYVDQIREYDKEHLSAAVGYLKEQRFDLAILLPNSFRSAWMMYRAGIGRRLGYARELRSLLLTDRVRPILRTVKQKGDDLAKRKALQMAGVRWPPRIGTAQQPMPEIDYYQGLMGYLGATSEQLSNRRMELVITESNRREADEAFASLGLDLPAAGVEGHSGIQGGGLGGSENPLVLLVPGASFGSSKCWPAERFARLADYLMDQQGDYRATVLLATAPSEKGIAQAILEASYLAPKGRLLALAQANNGRGVSLDCIKEVVRRCSLVVCNDTGPRHFAAALNIPFVTLFGPTDPRWAETFSARERIVSVPVPCGPCQLKKCPIDHRCMNELTVDMVLAKVNELWEHQDFDPRLADASDVKTPLP